MVKIPKIEWMAILKSVVLVELCFWTALIITGIIWLIFVFLAPAELINSFDIIKEIEYIMVIPGTLALFFGFWKSLSFIKCRKFLHMNIITFIVCLPDVASVPFFDDYALLEAMLNSFITYAIMLVAYGIGEYYPKHIRKSQA